MTLTGYQEDPLAISTSGRGEFRGTIDRDRAHIHLGGRGQSGGIMVFLCTNLGNGPAGTQPCPAAPATITGTISAADVIGPAGQGITAGQLSEMLAAIQAQAAYVNVHTTLYPSGEIRAKPTVSRRTRS